jgi:hypothetical protein
MDKTVMVDRQEEIDRNLEFFLNELPALPAGLGGKYALLRHQVIVDYYDTMLDALQAANSLYPDRMFSIQEVTSKAVDLGIFSHAVHLGAA